MPALLSRKPPVTDMGRKEVELPTVDGPAYLDVTNGVAHTSPECQIFVVHATLAAYCDSGQARGFEWCEACGGLPVVPWNGSGNQV